MHLNYFHLFWSDYIIECVIIYRKVRPVRKYLNSTLIPLCTFIPRIASTTERISYDRTQFSHGCFDLNKFINTEKNTRSMWFSTDAFLANLLRVCESITRMLFVYIKRGKIVVHNYQRVFYKKSRSYHVKVLPEV